MNKPITKPKKSLMEQVFEAIPNDLKFIKDFQSVNITEVTFKNDEIAMTIKFSNKESSKNNE